MNLNDALWTIRPANKTFCFDKIKLFYPEKPRKDIGGHDLPLNYEPGETAGNGFSYEFDGKILYDIISEDVFDTEYNISSAVTEEMDYILKDMKFSSVGMVSHLFKEEVDHIAIYPPSEESEMSMYIYLEGFEYPGFNE